MHPHRLRLLRSSDARDSAPSVVEEELLESVARALAEVRINGVKLDPPGERLTVEDLRAMRDRLARAAWERPSLPGEIPLSPLHREHDGWGPPPDATPEEHGPRQAMPTLLLAVDVLDFLLSMMGSRDLLQWESGP